MNYRSIDQHKQCLHLTLMEEEGKVPKDGAGESSHFPVPLINAPSADNSRQIEKYNCAQIVPICMHK